MKRLKLVQLVQVKRIEAKIEVIVLFHMIEIESFSHQSVSIHNLYFNTFDDCVFIFLGPQPSTYINATFIEGYDNSESFIITQDPLEETIGDFWRMISEQSTNTIVMISEVSSI